MIVFLQSLRSRKIQSSRLLAPRRQYPFVGGEVKRQLRRIGETDMDRYWQSNAATDPAAVPADNPGGFPANGKPVAGITGTVPGEWWFHSITEELRNAIVALGGTPDFARVNQLADVLVESFAKTVSTITGSLATVATTGSHHDLTDQPLIPASCGAGQCRLER
ncbi:hypothetical protein OKW41_005204 [Paraburkholderia sp. UCT70]|uniref:hypothetical protein n=1 Tax=Paraburkholderia sp. UCT70 TaxID=2991068 RepID=UPI003D20557D